MVQVSKYSCTTLSSIACLLGLLCILPFLHSSISSPKSHMFSGFIEVLRDSYSNLNPLLSTSLSKYLCNFSFSLDERERKRDHSPSITSLSKCLQQPIPNQAEASSRELHMGIRDPNTRTVTIASPSVP